MASAEEILSSLGDETEPHIVIDSDRTIHVPERLKKIGVQYDHNVETVTFDCPRYWDGRDLFDMIIAINYKGPDGLVETNGVSNVIVDEADDSIIHFDWTIMNDVTRYKGPLSFLVCGKKFNSDGTLYIHWNSKLNSDMSIAEGLECADSLDS